MSQHDEAGLETDPRFPSGPWRGFYLQPRLYTGRVGMQLRLRFSGGRLTGDGRDCVGAFLIRGRYHVDSGEVVLHKRYLKAHDVAYRGFAEPRHKGVWGTWQIRDIDRGGFHIWPEKSGEEDGLREAEQVEEPVARVVFEGDVVPATSCAFAFSDPPWQWL